MQRALSHVVEVSNAMGRVTSWCEEGVSNALERSPSHVMEKMRVMRKGRELHPTSWRD